MKKKTDKTQSRSAMFRADSINEDERSVEFVLSSDAVDTYRTVFKPEGWNLERYRSNPVVFYVHNDWTPDPDLLVGVSEVRMEDGLLIGKVFLEDADPEGDDNKLAEKVFRKIKKGTLRGASIRADIHEARMGNKSEGEDPDILYFTRMDLLEWSIVPLPSNPDALKRNAQNIESIKEELKPTEPTSDPEEKRTMSRFEAQLLLNENYI